MNIKEKIQRKEKLLAYLSSLSEEQKQEFSARVGTSLGQMKQMAYNRRPCNAGYAVAIDRETKGMVPMQEMHPDLDWDHVFKALQSKGAETDWSGVRKVIHEAVDRIDFGQHLPVKQAGDDDAAAAG